MSGEAARAKVNLFLHVTGRRADGYHLLDSLAVFPGAADVLDVEPADSLTLDLHGSFAAGLMAEPDNLVLRAGRALAAVAGVVPRARLVLHKNLPVASGIGGGSADAAAALRLLARLWDVRPGDDDLARIAVGLGADVPVCLASRPARMEGIGEVLGFAPVLPPCGLLLANPGVAVATAEVFRRRGAGVSLRAALPAGWDGFDGLASGLAALSNDLEAPAIAACPAIRDVLDWLHARPGCGLARMSGSGATCFALFPTAAMAVEASAGAPAGWWVWGGALD